MQKRIDDLPYWILYAALAFVLTFGAWLLSSCATIGHVEDGVYLFPQGEAMRCRHALRTECGWTYLGCGRQGETFACMPKPEVLL